MSREAILKVWETEKEAAEIVRIAKERAQIMRDAAEREGQEKCRVAEAETLAMRAQMMEQLHIKAEEHTDRVMEEARAEADELTQEISLRRKIAEKMIIRGLDMQCR